MRDPSIAAPVVAVSRKALRPPLGSPNLPELKSARLLDQLRERIRFLHYSRSTEAAYVFWARAFIRHHGLRHPRDLDGAAVESFLTWLASERQVAPATHRQALSALLFLYSKVLGVQLPWMSEIGRPRPQRRLPVVMSRDEVGKVLSVLGDDWRLFGQLLYGTGMRLTEGLRLRIKDVDFSHSTIIVREGKGRKDRVVMLPESLVAGLREQLAKSHAMWQQDQRDGRAGVEMPDALDRMSPQP